MWGIGKKRSRVGKFLDKHGRTQSELAKVAGINKETVSKVCNEYSYIPNGKTIGKIMKALRKIDPNLKSEDFFDI